MFNELVKQIKLALNLKKNPVGIRFLFIEEEYDEIKAQEAIGKKSICRYVYEAAENREHQKLTGENISCIGAISALGMEKEENFVKSGKQFSLMRLYSSLAVAKETTNNLQFLDFRIYGIEIGPLEEMKSADVVIMLTNAWQMMRIVQGYSYFYSMPQKIGMVGNQGVCAELISRPFQNNDMNISMLCPGARMHMKASENDIGCGIPMQQFEMIAKGVVKSTSLVMTKNEKEELLSRMNSPRDLECEIELDKMYGSYLKQSPFARERYNEVETNESKGVKEDEF